MFLVFGFLAVLGPQNLVSVGLNPPSGTTSSYIAAEILLVQVILKEQVCWSVWIA